MIKLMNQMLMLSGFYFVIAFVLSTWKNSFTYYAAMTAFVLFVVLFIILCFKKKFGFFEKFENKNPKVSNYVKAVGLPQYYNILFGMIPGFFVDENAYIPVYFKYAAIVYIILLFLSLIYATYVNFFKGRVWVKKKASKNKPVVETVKVEKIDPIADIVTAEEVDPLADIITVEETDPLADIVTVEETDPLADIVTAEDVDPLADVVEIKEVDKVAETVEVEEVKPEPKKKPATKKTTTKKTTAKKTTTKKNEK